MYIYIGTRNSAKIEGTKISWLFEMPLWVIEIDYITWKRVAITLSNI